MTQLDMVRLEIVKFMRGRYRLDEVASKYYDINCLKFRQGKRTILSINFHPDRYDFQIIYGKLEREKFERLRENFSEKMQEIYDHNKIYADGKWMLIPVSDLETLWEVKKLIEIKKNSNRKPFSREKAVYGKCGHRCDLCVHYTGITQEFRTMLIPHLVNVYSSTNWSMRCAGCDSADCHCCRDGSKLCEPLKCLHTKEFVSCFDCNQYPCEKATVGYTALEHKNISADDVTWAILPYVPYQYEK